MASGKGSRKTPGGARLPAGRHGPPSQPATPRLRPDDVVKNEELRGPVVRGGVGAVPSVWED